MPRFQNSNISEDNIFCGIYIHEMLHFIIYNNIKHVFLFWVSLIQLFSGFDLLQLFFSAVGRLSPPIIF